MFTSAKSEYHSFPTSFTIVYNVVIGSARANRIVGHDTTQLSKTQCYILCYGNTGNTLETNVHVFAVGK